MPPKKKKSPKMAPKEEEEEIIEMTAEDVLVKRNEKLPFDKTYYDIEEGEIEKIKNEITIFRASENDDPIMNIVDLDLVFYKEFLFNRSQDNPDAQLHAEFVNGYYQLLQKKYPENLYFTTHFMEAYDDERITIEKGEIIDMTVDGSGNFEGLKTFLHAHPKRRKTKEDMMEKMLNMIEADEKDRKVFFPVYISKNHFAVLVLDVKLKALVYYDSILYGKKKTTGTTNNADKYLYLVADFIMDYYKYREKDFVGKNKIKTFLDNIEMSLFQYDKSPQQHNGYDCGVYTCALGYLISANKRIPDPKENNKATFTKDQVQNVRLRIKESFMKGEITP